MTVPGLPCHRAVVGVLIALLLASCADPPPRADSGRTVTIGVVGPMTGSDMAKGVEGVRGIRAVMQWQSALDNGDRIELIIEDDQDRPELTLAALEKLTTEDHVSAVLMLSSSEPVLEISPLVDTHATPVLATLATHPDTTREVRFLSQLCFDDRFQGAVAALFVRDELLLDRVAVFYTPDSDYSRRLATEFAQQFAAVGGRITDLVALPHDTSEFRPVVNRIRQLNPELLYLPVEAAQVIGLVGAIRDTEWSPQFMGSDGLMATVLIQHQDQLGVLEGMLATDFGSRSMPLTPFGERAGSQFEGPATTYAMLGAEGYALLLAAMNRCEVPTNRRCINDAVRSTSNFQGAVGLISIGDDGRATRPLVVNALEGGEMRFVVKVY